MAEGDERSSGFKRSAKDFTSGCVAGVAQVLVGHPLNTIKSRLQMQPTPPIYESALHCFRATLREEGTRGLYRGMASPLCGVGLVNAVVFLANEESKRLIVASRGYAGLADLNAADAFAAGALTGAASSLITCPVELPMVRLQTERLLHPERKTSGPLAVARQLLAERGPRALFTGFAPTLQRETWSYAAYFAVYHQSKSVLASSDGGGVGASGAAFVAGGLAGQAGQIVALPIDAIKVRMQTDDLAKPNYRGALHATRQLWRAQGVRGFWRGIGPVVVRAFPVNGATFLAFEASMALLEPL